eukprot:1433222-Pleurochrysis_carterae.AAC.3
MGKKSRRPKGERESIAFSRSSHPSYPEVASRLGDEKAIDMMSSVWPAMRNAPSGRHNRASEIKELHNHKFISTAPSRNARQPQAKLDSCIAQFAEASRSGCTLLQQCFSHTERTTQQKHLLEAVKAASAFTLVSVRAAQKLNL